MSCKLKQRTVVEQGLIYFSVCLCVDLCVDESLAQVEVMGSGRLCK